MFLKYFAYSMHFLLRETNKNITYRCRMSCLFCAIESLLFLMLERRSICTLA